MPPVRPEPTEVADLDELTATEAKNRFGAVLEHVRDGGTTYITRGGRRVAAVVPADMAEHMAEIEDDYWGRRAQEVLDSTGEDDWIPMSQVFAALDLHDRGARGA